MDLSWGARSGLVGVKIAGDRVVVAQVRICRKSFAADGFRLGAARMEPTAGRRCDQIGHIAADALKRPFLGKFGYGI